MTPICSNDYQTIKGSPTKNRDDIIFGDMKTNGYSIVRSVMVAVMIAIVAVAGVVTFHQPPSLSNGDEPSMSSMALVHEDDGGNSNIDTIVFDKVLSTANKDGKQPPLISKEKSDSIMASCDLDRNWNPKKNKDMRNLNFRFDQDEIERNPHLPKRLGVSTSGCASFNRSTGSITGLFSVTVLGIPSSFINIRNGDFPSVQTIRISKRRTLFVSYNARPLCSGSSDVSDVTASCGGVVNIVMTLNRRNGSTVTESHFTVIEGSINEPKINY